MREKQEREREKSCEVAKIAKMQGGGGAKEKRPLLPLTSAHRLVESAIIEKWYPMSLKYSASVIPV